MKTSSAFFILIMTLLLLFRSDLAADERLTLYDRNKRNLQAQGSSSNANYDRGSQRRYYGGRDYYYDDYGDRGRERTIGPPTMPWGE